MHVHIRYKPIALHKFRPVSPMQQSVMPSSSILIDIKIGLWIRDPLYKYYLANIITIQRVSCVQNCITLQYSRGYNQYNNIKIIIMLKSENRRLHNV